MYIVILTNKNLENIPPEMALFGGSEEDEPNKTSIFAVSLRHILGSPSCCFDTARRPAAAMKFSGHPGYVSGFGFALSNALFWRS